MRDYPKKRVSLCELRCYFDTKLVTMRSKSFYEKPELELLTLRTDWDILLSAKNSENLTEIKGSWSMEEEEDEL